MKKIIAAIACLCISATINAQQLPDTQIKDVNSGKKVAFNETFAKGRVTVISFWATWCVPCIQEIPSFNKLHKDFAAQGVAVMGIAMDEEGAARVQPFLKKHPMDYPVGLGSEAINKQYTLDQLPVTLVFDRTGKQVKRFEGFTAEADLLAAVKQAL